MIKKATIIPTGDEVRAGIIMDTNSPMILQALVKKFPQCKVCIHEPVDDWEEGIQKAVFACVEAEMDLVVLIGGSGGGHRFSPSLGKDFTHSALERLLENKASGALYGKNGHLWCKLLCGTIQKTLVINVPGPFEEAKAAIEAFCAAYQTPCAPEVINKAMLDAVKGRYTF